MSKATETDSPLAADEAPSWEAVTAFIEWDERLPPGTRLRDYDIRSVIGDSSFGIVYLAWDYSLQRRVAIKEYMPRALAARERGSSAVRVTRVGAEANFEIGLKGFIAEARMLARFEHAALAKVYRFWTENGTAYMAMPFYEGPSLETALQQLGRPQDEAEVRAWLRPILDALSVMHAARCYHHHIGTDNIVLTATGPVLLDFAAARRLIGSLADGPGSVVKAGYAPIEQYSEAATLAPGPWTDLYALAALAYRAIAGHAPPPAPERLRDDRLPALASIAAGRCSDGFAAAIDAALAIAPERRPSNDTEWRELIGGIDAPLPPIALGPSLDLMAEPFAPDAQRMAIEVTLPQPTQPDPPPTDAANDPSNESIVAAAPAPSAAPAEAEPAIVRAPFERERGLGRKGRIALGAALLGSIVLGAVVLYPNAGDRTGPAPTPTAPATPTRPAAAKSPGPGATARGAAARPATLPVAVVPPTAAPTRNDVTAGAVPTSVPRSMQEATQGQRSPALPTPTLAGPPGPGVAITSTPIDAAERRARCDDVLQEASLRRLSAAEAAFFKKECR